MTLLPRQETAGRGGGSFSGTKGVLVVLDGKEDRVSGDLKLDELIEV